MKRHLALTSLKDLVLCFISHMILPPHHIFLLFVPPPQLHFMSLHVLPHKEMIWPSIFLKRTSSNKQLAWNLFNLWRSEQSFPAGGEEEILAQPVCNLQSCNRISPHSFNCFCRLCTRDQQSSVGLERVQLNIKYPTKVTLHSHLVNTTAPKPFWVSFLSSENWGVVLEAI